MFWLESVRLKTKGTVYKHFSLADKVISHRDTVNNSETVVHES